MSRRWLGLLVAGPVLFGSALAAAQVTGGSSTPSPHYEPDTSCDVDGVSTGYDVTFGDATSDYRVTHVDVRDISPTCEGGTATVILSRAADDVELGRGSVGMDASGEAKVAIGPLPAADGVTRIRVELAGGTVPVPQACKDAGMGFDRVTVGEVENDHITGTSRRDLIFALPGDDDVNGLANPDCLDGAPGDDHLRGGEGDDVVLGAAGDDDLDGEQGRDTVEGGAGNDRLAGGAGDDILRGGEGDDRIVGGVGRDTCIGGDGYDTFVSCETVVQ